MGMRNVLRVMIHIPRGRKWEGKGHGEISNTA